MNVPANLTTQQIAALVLDTEPYVSCEECFDLMDEYVDALAERRAPASPALVTHLHGCPACAEEVASLLELVGDPDGHDG